MQKSERSRLARQQLDKRLAQFSPIGPVPHRGWIRAIRDALGMTTRQLAARTGSAHTTVAQWEKSEVAGSIQLSTLTRAADALDCDLVYALVPRTSLDQIVRRRAEDLAARDVGLVDQMMILEGQQVDAAALDDRRRSYADALITAGRLWETDPGDSPRWERSSGRDTASRRRAP